MLTAPNPTPEDMKKELDFRVEQAEKIKAECRRKFIAEIALQLAINDSYSFKSAIKMAEILAEAHDDYVYR